MKIVLLGLVGVLLFVALVGGIWAYRWTIAPTRGTVEQREITIGVSTGYRLMSNSIAGTNSERPCALS